MPKPIPANEIPLEIKQAQQEMMNEQTKKAAETTQDILKSKNHVDRNP